MKFPTRLLGVPFSPSDGVLWCEEKGILRSYEEKGSLALVRETGTCALVRGKGAFALMQRIGDFALVRGKGYVALVRAEGALLGAMCWCGKVKFALVPGKRAVALV